MKKNKINRKLHLARETVRNLSRVDGGKVIEWEPSVDDLDCQNSLDVICAKTRP